MDLGAGAGIPGLVLASIPLPGITGVVLLEGSQRRAEWLQSCVEALDLASTVEVLGLRAEIAGRQPSWRGSIAVVVARSFGRPAVVAECAGPLLEVGGYLVVSEPPMATDEAEGAPLPVVSQLSTSEGVTGRWPSEAVAELGYSPAREWNAGGFRYAVLRVEAPCPERYPRRDGIPAKRPLF